MEKVNIRELGLKVNIKLNQSFLRKINLLIRKRFKSKEKFYNKEVKDKINIPYGTFRNLFKYSYYNTGFFAPLEVFILCCDKLNIDKYKMQGNIESYKTRRGWNIISEPILPIKITPLFDMLLAHNIADGTVINPKRNRQIYFGYRQFDIKMRKAYVEKIESIFGKIKFKKENYFEKTTRPYCPAVLSQLFFSTYNLNVKSFLSRSARIPLKILEKNSDYLLSVLLAFIIDEGHIDSTLIAIRLKNPRLVQDLENLCKKLEYRYTTKIRGSYGELYILRRGMNALFKDYKKLIVKYPEAHLGKSHEKIENSLKIYDRKIYKTKGNRELILKMLKLEDLTVNQIANKINMTRQGVRFHIHNLEKMEKIIKRGTMGEGNIIYEVAGGRRC